MSLEYEPWPFLSKIQRLHLIIENHECTKIPMITGNTKCVFIDRSGISRNWNAKNYMYCHMVYILSDMNRNKLSYSRQLSCVPICLQVGKTWLFPLIMVHLPYIPSSVCHVRVLPCFLLTM